MQNVLLGGLITLAGTALVQMFVIPWVQRRTRALERWERDVIELMTLVNEEMNDKLARLAELLTDDLCHLMYVAREMEDQDPESDPVISSPALAYAERSWEDTQELSTKIVKTLRRCALVSPRSPYWIQIFNQVQDFRQLLASLHPVRFVYVEKKIDPERITDATQNILDAQDRLSVRLEQITQPVRPPKQPRRRLALPGRTKSAFLK